MTGIIIINDTVDMIEWVQYHNKVSIEWLNYKQNEFTTCLPTEQLLFQQAHENYC